jgi:hypothetical protein
MSVLSKVYAAGEVLMHDGKGMVLDAEHYLASIEPEIASLVAPLVAKVRSAFSDELGYIAGQSLDAVKSVALKAVQAELPNHAGDPVALIHAVFADVLKAMPSILSAAEQLALHGLISALVAALA